MEIWDFTENNLEVHTFRDDEAIGIHFTIKFEEDDSLKVMIYELE